MVSFWAAPGVLVTLPIEEARVVFDLASATDSIVFWTGGPGRDGRPGTNWQPLLMPRPKAPQAVAS